MALVLGPVGLAAWGDGYERTRVPLSSGGAWLGSVPQGLVTLVDGASEQVVGSLRVDAVKGPGMSVVQGGSSAYVTNPGRGSVVRVDAATFETSPPVQFGDGSGSLDVLTSERAVYVLDGGRRMVSVADPTSLRLRGRPLALAARPGAGQAVVDAAGRLWVIDQDRGGLTGFDGGNRVQQQVGDAHSRFALVQGQPVLVDVTQGKVAALTSAGTVRQWSCLEVRAQDQVQVLGSASSSRVFAAVRATGTLLASSVDHKDCGLSVPVGKPGDDFGPLVESAGFVFVPDWTSGHTVVVDVATGGVAADLTVGPPSARVELLAKDGFVFYNDPQTDRAGVIRLDGGQWRLGKAMQKFDPANVSKGILTPANQATGIPALNTLPSPTASPSASPEQSPARDTKPQAGPPPPDETPTHDNGSSPNDHPPTSTPPSTKPPGRPNIVGLTASDPKPGLGQTVTFSARETVAGSAAIWTWTVTNSETGQTVTSGQKPAGAKFTWKFTETANYRVQLTVTYQGLEDHAVTRIEASDQCDLRRVGDNPVYLPDNTGTLQVTMVNCFATHRVEVNPKSFVGVDKTTFTLSPGQTGRVGVFADGTTPAGHGTNDEAVAFRLDNGNTVLFDIKFNIAPDMVGMPSCVGHHQNSDSDWYIRLQAVVDDGDVDNLRVSVRTDGRTRTMPLTSTSRGGIRGTFVLDLPQDQVGTGNIPAWEVRAVDSGGQATDWVVGEECWS